MAKVRADAARRASYEEDARKAAKERTKELARLRSAAFGSDRLFGAALAVPLPVPFAAVGIEALAGLPAGSGGASWTHLTASRGDGGRPSIAGFLRKGNTCFALSVLQMLLRLPAFAV